MPDNHPKQKIASSDYDIHQLLKKRWSPRAFADTPVERETLRQLFDAARWAPSCYNEQPWRFVVATKEQPDEYARMTEVLNEANRTWATQAPVLIMTLAKDHFDRNGKPNRHAQHDLGLAVASMTFEATKLGLYVHQMAGILPEQGRELFHIPDHYTIMTMIAIGYLGDPETLPEDKKKSERAERSRLGIDKIVFRGQWDNPSRI